jgi:hypothetical protein
MQAIENAEEDIFRGGVNGGEGERRTSPIAR